MNESETAMIDNDVVMMSSIDGDDGDVDENGDNDTGEGDDQALGMPVESSMTTQRKNRQTIEQPPDIWAFNACKKFRAVFELATLC